MSRTIGPIATAPSQTLLTRDQGRTSLRIKDIVLAAFSYPSSLHRLYMAGNRVDILAVANAGSLAGAARNIGVNHTTVLRRVGAFETGLGLRLFERMPTGVLTPGGEELVAAAGQIEDAVTSVSANWWQLAGLDFESVSAGRFL
jgi:molybdate transport repressor ModE-like protein